MRLRLTVRVSDDIGDVQALREIVESSARMVGFLAPEAAEIILAVHEGLANIFAHGCPEGGRDAATVRILCEPDVIEVVIADRCVPVASERVCPRAWDDARPGGMGIPLMRKIMDSVDHLPRRGRGNVLRMTRRRKGGARC